MLLVCASYRVPYMLNLLLYYLSIANGIGGVGFLNFSYLNVLYRSYWVKNKVIDVPYILNTTIIIGILFVMLREGCMGFVHTFIWRKPAVMRTNDQGLTNLYGSVVFIFNIDWCCFWVPQNHRRVVSTGRNGCRFHN